MNSQYVRETARWLLPCCAALVIVLQTFATLVFAQTDVTYTFATVDVPLPSGQLGFTSLQDINDDGQITGSFTNSGGPAFLLEVKKNTVQRTQVRCHGRRDVLDIAPQSINTLGEIAGFANVVVDTDTTQIKGFFRDTKGKCTILDFPGANLTEAIGLNDAGQVVGDYRDANTGIFHGFLWDAGQFLTIDVPFTGASSTSPSGINNIGEIVGSYFDNNVGHFRGFLYYGIFISVSELPNAVFTQLRDINDNGQIVGIFGAGGSEGFSFVIDSNGAYTMFDVPFPGVVTTVVRGINNQGQIVGRYLESNPNDPVNPFPSRGFVASPNVNSPLVASLTEGQSLDPKKPDPAPQLLTDESQKIVTNGEAGGQLCFVDDTTPAAFVFALSKAGLCLR